MIPDGVAIVGMAGRFPGARDVGAFWTNIRNGVESITHFGPADLDIPVPATTADETDATFVCAKGILEDIEMFDARFFGCLPREAELMDPQHRIFLELCSEAIEHAGHDVRRYPGSIGVYGGCYMDTYLMWNLCSDPRFLARLVDSIQVGSLQTELGNDKDYLATRVAFKLGLRGPAMTVQTACSTSLVAIATACQSVASYQCDMALAGGVTIVLPQRKGYYYKEGGMLSPDGHCRTFDEHAAGTVFSNGAAVVLLKRVADAVADGDTIYAVIRGYAANNDGGAKVSYTAPSVEGQSEVISLALATADIDARTIGYVEAHGTATPMGDPIEIAGLTTAYRAHTDDTAYCAIGSVKANLGHLDVASGAIGLIKTAMAIHDAVLPPSINFSRPNPKIDFANSPFYVNTQLRPWPAAEWPRRAGVSSFGVGGTNAHVIVEQAPPPRPAGRQRSHSLLLLSARSETALAAQAGRLASFLEDHPDASLEDVAYTLQVGRSEFEHRRIVVANDCAGAVTALRGTAVPGDLGRLRASRPEVVFMFPGQGAQYPGMARELHASEPVFREVIDRCCNALQRDGDGAQDPRPYLLWDPAHSSLDAARAAAELTQTRLAQPALFAMEMALARLLESWGIRAAAVLGHSVGEFAAACIAGVFELEDAMRLVALRGRLMQAQPPGAMLAVRASTARIEPLLPPGVVVAAVNAPELTVISGPGDLIAALATGLAESGIQASSLVTSHAYHSPMMAPVRMPLVTAVAAVPRRPATLPIISTALARVAGADELCDPDYWGAQLLSPVRFADCIAVAAPDAHRIVLEVGPGQTLTTLARQTLGRENARGAIPSQGPVQSAASSVATLLAAVGRLWLSGMTPDWSGFQAGVRQRVALPTYPFERRRFWVEPMALDASRARGDADALDMQPAITETPTSRRPDGAQAEPAAGVERLIEQQLALIAEQIRMLAEAPDAGAPTGSLSAGSKPIR
jgi:acyl transferase domain-containing protein